MCWIIAHWADIQTPKIGDDPFQNSEFAKLHKFILIKIEFSTGS